MALKCPTTEKSWGRKSAAKGCSPKGNYHCVQTQDGDVIELCTNPIWIEAGKCPVYNRARILDSKLCQPRVLQTICPPNVYRSNQVFKYTACFPENSISTTSTQTSTLIGKQTMNTTTIPTSDDGGTGLELLAVLILIPFMLGFLVVLYLQRRGYIKLHRLCTSDRERSEKSSVLKSSADKGHCSIDIGENKEESEKFLPDDTDVQRKEDPGEKDSETRIDRSTTGTEVLKKESSEDKDNENHTPITEKQASKDSTKSSSEDGVKNTKETAGIVLNTSYEPDLSMVGRMSEVLSGKDMLIITGLPGSGKSTLALKITEAACRKFTNGANMRFIKNLEELNEIMSDKETFLILDNCIKSWFNEICVNLVFKKISEVLQNKKDRVHVLLCAPPEIWSKFGKLLLSSDFQYEMLDLTDVTSYTDSDWDKIFYWHMLRNIERKKYKNQEKRHVIKWIEDYRKLEAKEIGKPAIAHLLCRSVETLENLTFLSRNPRQFLESEIKGVMNLSSFLRKNYDSFIVLVYLMLHNGKAMSNQMESKIIEDICSAYKIPKNHIGSVKKVKYDEIEVKQNEMSVRSNEVVRATFDFVWKDHKDLIIRYCDDDLFLDRVTLNGSEEEVVDIAKRFKSMINEGKCNVEHHYLLEDPRFKHLVQQ